MRITASLALAQVRHRPARWVLLAAGIALAIVIPIVAAGMAQVVSAQTVRRAIDALPVAQRTVTVTGQWWIYTSGHSQHEVDTTVDQAIRSLTTRPIRRELTYRQIAENGAAFFLTAADDLPGAVRLTSGHWPSRCEPTRCEVVQLGESIDRTAAAVVARYGVEIVGTAVRTDDTFMSGTFDTGTSTVLVGNGVDTMAHLAALENFGRTYGWVTALDSALIVRLGMREYVRRVNAVEDRLTIGFNGLGLEQQSARLVEEDARARVSAGRFDLLSGAAAVMLLGFVFVAAVSLRREHQVLTRVLRTRGASQTTAVAVSAACLAFVALAGAAVGIVLALAGVSALLLSENLSVPARLGDVIASSWHAPVLLPLLGVLIALAVLVWPDARASIGWHVVELTALVAVLVAWLAGSRGRVAIDTVANGHDPLLVALPALVAVTAACVAARIWPLAVMHAPRAAARSLVVRIALLSAVRRPLRAVATAGFTAAACCVVVFAGAYRSTLDGGAAVQAVARVPLDATAAARAGEPASGILDSISADAVRGLGEGAALHGVVRTTALVRSSTADVSSVPVLGMDPDSLTYIRHWAAVTGTARSASDLRSALTPAGNASNPSGLVLPSGARTFEVRVQGQKTGVAVLAWFRDEQGREASAALAQVKGTSRSADTRVAAVPDLRGQIELFAITVGETDDYARRHLHAIGEGISDQGVLTGTLVLTGPAFATDHGTIPVTWPQWTASGTDSSVGPQALSVPYRLAGTSVVVTSELPALPVLVDPHTAATADHGTLAVTVGGLTVPARVVAVSPRFPTMGETFVVAARTTLTRVLDRAQPGDGALSELWISAPNADLATLHAAVGRPDFDRLDVTLQADLEHALATDPVARGSAHLLALVAVLMAAVSFLSLVLFVLGERRDDAGELYAWEADGVRASSLRHVIVVRGVSLLVVALPVGTLAGVVLARIGAALVAVTATGVTADPPLHTALSVRVLLTATAMIFAFGVLLMVGAASFCLRERLPVQAEVDLR